MISALARRLGFRSTVPATLVGDWLGVAADPDAMRLGPRGGDATVDVGSSGRLHPVDTTWCVDWAVAAGANWHIAVDGASTRRELIGPATVQTTMKTPDGPVRQRVAAAVVDGRPVLLVEFVNDARVAVAVAAVVRPLTMTGRGFAGSIEVDAERASIDGGSASIRWVDRPAALRATTGAQGDQLADLPAADEGADVGAIHCRSGAAQLGAVWPLPHTGSVRYLIELDGLTSADAAVPGISDVQRGWQRHLSDGLRVSVPDNIAEGLAASQRCLLTVPPDPAQVPQTLQTLSESGFVDEARDLLGKLPEEHDEAVLRAVARWFQLDPDLDRLNEALVSTARAAHGVATSATPLSGPAWLGPALSGLAGGLAAIDQPDVAQRVRSISSAPASAASPERLLEFARAADATWCWPGDQLSAAAAFVDATRGTLLVDEGHRCDVLAAVPSAWRGHGLELFNAPVSGGRLSFGVRWHGPRPALLWEFDGDDEAPFEIRATAIDPAFVSHDHVGETLLADPGWPTA